MNGKSSLNKLTKQDRRKTVERLGWRPCRATRHYRMMGMFFLCATVCLSVQAAPVHVMVDTSKVLYRVAERDFHGVNFVALWNDTQDAPPTAKAFSQMGSGLVRFPGGCPAQWYDWETPLASGWTELTPARAVAFAATAKARMIFQTNTATDTTGTNEKTGKTYRFDSSGNHAAGWVQLAREKKWPVALWEIGNEPEIDAPQPVKDQNSQEAVYAWYNAKFKEQAQAIRKVDPAAKLMGPASCNTWFWWAQGNLARFLSAHGNKTGSGLVDVVSVHWYPEGSAGSWEQKRGSAQEWEKCMAFIRKTVSEHDTRDLPICVSEWNWGAGDKSDGAESLANALGVADVIGMFLRTGVSGHQFFCLQHIQRNWGVLATGNDSRSQHEASPTYYALCLASKLGGQVLATTSDADERESLSSYATRHADGSIQVLLINKGDTAAQVSLACKGVSLVGRRLSLNTLSGADPTQGVQAKNVRFNGVVSPRPWEAPLPSPQALRATNASATFEMPALSLAVVEMPAFSMAVVEIR